jgi:hypothetical protein
VLIWFSSTENSLLVCKNSLLVCENSLLGGGNFPAGDAAILQEGERSQALVRYFGASNRDFSLLAGNLLRPSASL